MADRRSTWLVGDTVQTPFGKGVIRQVRANGRVLVQVQSRNLLIAADALSPADRSRSRAAPRASAPAGAEWRPDRTPARTPAVLDLHGLTVEEALGAVDRALSDALLADAAQMRLIHGRSGGRIRAALHRHLRGAPGVRRFHIDPQNAGVTVVEL